MDFSNIPELPSRPIDAHKGLFGHCILIGGAKGMSGAIAIAGMACSRAGAGNVTLAVPECSHGIVAMLDPHYMTLPLPCDSDGRLSAEAECKLTTFLQRASNLRKICIAIGPGLGRSESSDNIVAQLFESIPHTLVVDADALNSLSESRIWKRLLCGKISPNPVLRILTPHPGEWERLSGVSATDREGQVSAAQSIAARTNCIVVLKGNQSVITDGGRCFVNTTGNASMAIGGSGDCLTGMIAALVCQGMLGIDAARLGTHLHGLAGDLAHDELGTPSTLAKDLIRFLPNAFRRLKAEK